MHRDVSAGQGTFNKTFSKTDFSWITSYVAHPFLMNILVKASGSSFSTLEVERWKVRAASEFELTFRGKQVKSNSLDANCEGSK